MAKKKLIKKTTPVRSFRRKVPISKKNPDGTTLVDPFIRHFNGIDAEEIRKLSQKYNLKKLILPTSKALKFTDADSYDNLIAIWTDYFNKKFLPIPPDNLLDPNIVKALIASESEFKKAARSSKAYGIAQITKQTLSIMTDQSGEVKEFAFKDIRLKDLDDPEIAIPMAIRWLFRKRETATHSLGRPPSIEELILEYKGLLKSKSAFQQNALTNFRDNYAKLNKKYSALYFDHFCFICWMYFFSLQDT